MRGTVTTTDHEGQGPSMVARGRNALRVAAIVAVALLMVVTLAGVGAWAQGGAPVAAGEDGAAVAFGHIGSGQTNVPVLPEGVTYTAVAAGGHHTVLLRSDGAAVAFGHNSQGQTNVPALPDGMTYTAVAAGTYHTVLLRSDGAAVAFGHNSEGQTDVPVLPDGMTYTGVAASFEHTVLLRSDGAAVAFGWNGYGQTDVPALPDGMTYTAVAAGGWHTVLLRSDGAAVAFGWNGDGQTDVPVLPDGMTYTGVAAGGWHTVLLRSDGAAVAFGWNPVGQTDVPLLEPGVTYTAAAVGTYHTVLLRSDGAAVAFGDYLDGQTDVPVLPDGMTYTGVAAGGWHTVLLRSATETIITVTSDTAVAGEESTLTATVTSSPTPGIDYTGSVVFTVDGTDLGPVAIDSDGMAQIPYTFTQAGQRTVEARYTGATDGNYRESTTTATVTVTAAAPTTIGLSPATFTVAAGDTVIYTVTGTDSYGNTGVLDATEATLSTATGTVTGHDVVFTEAGEHTVTATLTSDPTITATTTVTVTAGVAVEIDLIAVNLDAEDLRVDQGDTVVFEVTGIDAHGNVVDIDPATVTLTSDQPTDVIDGLSVYFPQASPHIITATMGSLSASVTINVTPADTDETTDNGTADGATDDAALSDSGAHLGALPAAVIALMLGGALLMASRSKLPAATEQ